MRTAWVLAVAAAVTTQVTAGGQLRLPAAENRGSIEATYLASIGGGPGNGRFKLPRGLAVAPTGEVYVADSGYCRIQVFDGNGIFLRKWGTPGDGPGEFRDPAAIAINAADVYVADTMNHRVQVFTRDGVFVRMWGSKGGGDGEFNSPWGLAVDADADVYVADTYNYRIQVFTKDGTFLRKWGAKGNGPGEFVHPGLRGGVRPGPAGIAIANRDVYVTDPGNFRAQVFALDGTYLREWGLVAGPDTTWYAPAAIAPGLRVGYMNAPHAIAVDQSGHILVVNNGTSNTLSAYHVQKFTAAGEFRQRWGKDGTEPGQFDSPQGVAVDAAGNFYVADTVNNRVQKFSSDGRFLTQWGSTGDGLLRNPSGIAVDTAGNIFVVDHGNKRVQKFSASGLFLSKWGSRQRWPRRGEFYSPGRIAIDSRGRVFVTDLLSPTQIFTPDGRFISTWNQRGFDRDEFSTHLVIDRDDHLFIVTDEKVAKVTLEGKRLRSWPAFPFDIALDADDNLYVTDAQDGSVGRIRVLAPSGREIARWHATQGPDGQWGQYKGITVTPGNHVIALDWRNCRIEVFTRKGELRGRWGSCGFGPGRFGELNDVVVDASGRVYVTDYTNNCVQVFQLHEKRSALLSPPDARKRISEWDAAKGRFPGSVGSVPASN
jgi:DNA-binding beta-propeller fold protein YncE